jgi:hypothetical protein
MVYNSTNINKMNNHLSPYTLDHKKTAIYVVGIPIHGLRQTQKMRLVGQIYKFTYVIVCYNHTSRGEWYHSPIKLITTTWHNWFVVLKKNNITNPTLPWWVGGAAVAMIVWELDLQLPMQSLLSPLILWVRIQLGRGVLDTTLCDKVCQWLAAGLWFSPCTLVSSTNKTDCHDITEILLKVMLNTINQPTNQTNLLKHVV